VRPTGSKTERDQAEISCGRLRRRSAPPATQTSTQLAGSCAAARLPWHPSTTRKRTRKALGLVGHAVPLLERSSETSPPPGGAAPPPSPAFNLWTMEEQQVKPSDVPPTIIDNQDSAANPVTAADPVPLAASTDSSVGPAVISAPTAVQAKDAAGQEAPASMFSTSGLSSWAKNLKIPQHSSSQESPTGKNTFARFTSGLGLCVSPKAAQQNDGAEGSTSPTTAQSGDFGYLTKGSASQVSPHGLTELKKIPENIIAMGFPAGDLISGLFGYFEGFYRNHMEEVIRFFEMHHKVACFPFDDHNCPPIRLVISFCYSAYSWLKEDIENVVVVHCKAGNARTGLMISSLLLFLKFFPTAEESIEYYNQKRCVDGKGLILPSQIRYVKYSECILTYFNGENQPPRRCMLRGFHLHRCPYWIRPSITVSNHNGVLFSTKKHPRTKELMVCQLFGSPALEDFCFSAPKKRILVFALPGEPGLAEVAGDFKITFHDRQGDFYCWLNTTMTENSVTLNPTDLDDFDKKIAVTGVLGRDYDGSQPPKPKPAAGPADKKSGAGSSPSIVVDTYESKGAGSNDKDEVFSDSEGEDGSSKGRKQKDANSQGSGSAAKPSETTAVQEEITVAASKVGKVAITSDQGTANVSDATSLKTEVISQGSSTTTPTPPVESSSMSEFKAIAADASVFSFGDEDDYESE
ncbi:hypothetical protein EJB05_01954, partial [Eragrostis curvula]